MMKWQEIVLNGIMNFSVLVVGSGVVAYLLNQADIKTIGLATLIGSYGMMAVTAIAYNIERKK